MEINWSNFLCDGDRVLVGVSGGADSMCLLSLLAGQREKTRFSLTAVHVNHSIRGDEADRDQEVVKNFCENIGVPLIIEKVDAINYSKANGKTLEEGARELRYMVFEKLKNELKANKLFVAHNMSDQAETVLMHISRGSSLAGATGIKDKGDFIFRPLLSVSREEILAYNKENKVPFVVDSTNLDVSYTRNFFRHEVLPLIEKHYPNAKKSISNFASLCARDEDYILKTLDLSLVHKTGEGVLIANKISSLHPACSTRLVRFALNEMGQFADFNEVHINDILSLFNSKSGAKKDLPHGVVAHRDYEGVTLTKKKGSSAAGEIKFEPRDMTFNGRTIRVEIKGEVKAFEKGKIYFDIDKLAGDETIRNPQKSDIFRKLGSCGSKKLCDYFTDKKIEKRKRNDIIILARGSVVLAVLGFDVSEEVKITNETKRVCVLSF